MKGVVDRFSEEFVETRMKALDKFLKRVADHPVLSFNSHLNAFLSAKVRRRKRRRPENFRCMRSLCQKCVWKRRRQGRVSRGEGREEQKEREEEEGGGGEKVEKRWKERGENKEGSKRWMEGGEVMETAQFKTASIWLKVFILTRCFFHEFTI